jgi:hypothetical protein
VAYGTPYWRLQAPRHRHDTGHDPRTGDSGFPFRSVLVQVVRMVPSRPLRVGSVYGLPPTGGSRPNDNTQFLPKEERRVWWVAFRNKPGSMRDYSNIRMLNYFPPPSFGRSALRLEMRRERCVPCVGLRRRRRVSKSEGIDEELRAGQPDTREGDPRREVR